jgi:hypothetical protein
MTSRQTRVAVLSDNRALAITKAAFLLGIVLVSPMFFSQPVTGVFVNAALVLAALFFGIRKEAILIAVAPSLVALVRGQLPAAFLPIVPFIMVGNLVLIAGFHLTYRKYRNFLLAAGLGSVLKFAFLLSVAVAFSLTLFAGSPLAAKVTTMFGILQLGTALGGSIVAFVVARMLGLLDKDEQEVA